MHPIANLSSQLKVLDLGDWLFPVSINDGDELAPSGEANTYVVSPVTAYGDYALEELLRLKKTWLELIGSPLLRGLRLIMRRAGLDRVVQINNWLLSTNLYPAGWTGEGLEQLLPQLVLEYPHHALVFRSLNEVSNSGLIAKLRSLGFIPVPSRQVYLFGGRGSAEFIKCRNNQIDSRLLSSVPLQQVEGADFTPEDFVRAQQLYDLLYLHKYSRLNPQYTAQWLRAGRDQGWLKLRGLRQDGGELLGVVGWFDMDGVITAPIVGYDTGADNRLGLYRLLTQLCVQRAAREGRLLNFSSGAAHFKRLRGGEPAIECSLVYIRHLPLRQALVWRLLAGFLNVFALPMMKRWKL